VIWTRHRRGPDTTSQIREWFMQAGFTEEAFDSPADSGCDPDEESGYCVATFGLTGALLPYQRGVRLFAFVR
jgi:hypothetical protein